MSNSRSPTPTPNTVPSNTASSPAPADPGLEPSPEQTFHHSPEALHQQSTSTVRLSRSSTVPTSSRSHPHPEDRLSSQPPKKRMRRRGSEGREMLRGRSSPSGSSSQEDMADTEQRSDPSVVTAATGQKKRTRTLTTPHQTAVLHALLAKSRFPSTAMREEVGRSIGLSARKVQIWFQNQRQKARKPPSHSGAPLPGPPQYGPFPTPPSSHTAPLYSNFTLDPVQSGSSSSVGERAGPPSHYESRGVEHSPFAYHPPYEPHDRSPDSASQLQGPGVPGSGSSIRRPAYRGLPDRDLPFVSRQDPSGQFLRTPRGYSSPETSTGYGRSLTDPRQPRERAPSRTLPPLTFDTHLRQDSVLFPVARSGRSHFSAPQHASSSAHQQPGPTSGVILPPPFTLQPRPQWDSSSYPAVPSHRPTSSWDRPSSSYRSGEQSRPMSSHRGTGERSSSMRLHGRRASDMTSGEGRLHSPLVAAQDLPRHERDPYHVMEPSPPRRSRRFDPVRSVFVQSDPQPEPSRSSSTRPQDYSPREPVHGRSPPPR